MSAQAESLVSLSAGLGLGSSVDDGMAWRLTASGVSGPVFFGLRAGGVEQFDILGPRPVETIRDFGLLVGYASNDERTLRYAALGVGGVRRTRRVGEGTPSLFGRYYQTRQDTAIGVPFELGGVRHGEHFGVGLTVFGNVNGAGSYVAVALTVHVGRMR